jgi:hypothetical protein
MNNSRNYCNRDISNQMKKHDAIEQHTVSVLFAETWCCRSHWKLIMQKGRTSHQYGP